MKVSAVFLFMRIVTQSPCVLIPDRGIRLAEIQDGTSNTLAIGERIYHAIDVAWLHGAFWADLPSAGPVFCVPPTKNVRWPINADLDTYGRYASKVQDCEQGSLMCYNDLIFGSWHPGGALFSFVDGSVHFVNQSLKLSVYKDLATISGNEVNRWNP